MVVALTFFLLAFAPGVFWFWFFARKDRYRPEPKRLIAMTFGLGVASTIPVLVAGSILGYEWAFDPLLEFSGDVGVAILIAAATEEFMKFFVVWLVPYRSLHFDEPSDGLVYSAAASLGFASIENFAYIVQFGPEVMVLRAPLSTVGHVIFSSFWGYALARIRISGNPAVLGVPIGLAVASLAHAAFNVAAIHFQIVLIPIVILGLWWTMHRFDWANAVSPFRFRRNYPRINCVACGKSITVISQYCRFCGQGVADTDYELICSQCRTLNRSDADYCTTCGDKFMFG